MYRKIIALTQAIASLHITVIVSTNIKIYAGFSGNTYKIMNSRKCSMVLF